MNDDARACEDVEVRERDDLSAEVYLAGSRGLVRRGRGLVSRGRGLVSREAEVRERDELAVAIY